METNNRNLIITSFLILKDEEEVEPNTIHSITSQGQQTSQALSALGVTGLAIINQNVELSCIDNEEKKTNFVEKDEEVYFLMVCHVKEEANKNLWYLDMSCNNHMSGDKNAFLFWMSLFEILSSLEITLKYRSWEKEG